MSAVSFSLCYIIPSLSPFLSFSLSLFLPFSLFVGCSSPALPWLHPPPSLLRAHAHTHTHLAPPRTPPPRSVVRKCAEHGISLFIDPHQDVWSRWTGGDGAPAWTLQQVGFNLTALSLSGAAVTHQEAGEEYPQMVWPTNSNRLAAATMFTLFFAGDEFAPSCRVQGVRVQQYLQSHFLNAMAALDPAETTAIS